MTNINELLLSNAFILNAQRSDSTFSNIIHQSLMRSRENKIDPNRKKGKVNKELWQRSILHNEELFHTTLPLMKDIFQLVAGTGFMVVICDKNGLLLKTIGDEDTLQKAREISFIEGADWSEETVGTNAIGTCIKEQIPLQVFHDEHYMKICQEWTCSASPIFGNDGKLLGVLNVSGPYEKVHQHTLGMVVSTARAVENLMKLQDKINRNELMKSYLEATMNTLTSGIILVNHQGEIIQANKTLLDMLQLEEDIIDKKIYELFANQIFQDGNYAIKIKDKDIHLKLKRGNSKHVVLNSQSVYQGEKQIGSLLTLQEIQKVRQMVNRFTGNRANITFKEIIGENELFLTSLREAKSASNSPSNVLLLGESGTGKDLFAQAIHNESDRRKMPFIAINCGAIPRDLLGSELFGYVDGAFTGARKGGSSGKFELADGGTIFLDEIGEMSLDMQVLLLRVLQNREINRIGDHKVIPVDVRIIAATNKNLKDEVRKGNFREDLYFRLNVLPIHIPGLRYREEDISLLASHFVKHYNQKIPKQIETISPSYMKAIEKYNWPGNVRELQNVIERSLNRCTTEVLSIECLPDEIQTVNIDTPSDQNLVSRKDVLQKQALLEVIMNCDYNYSKAAKKLNISRSTLYRRLERFNLR
ncbi:sigma 54-interacting transcriptional regulator [Neobacillus drentensis]|uniref:sigma-54-dependent Fis family transcriptional regulator n=1 Tax=Neobacillus drentensis TaxID=220684 RepID=UPI001F2B4C29|nr:sigma 54-interacting transcriptional regulator [Neobacillus drentensis]ULT58925.1 sigma 54-interacting transcriptional regulator [Neobacillus drentensis]